MPSTKKQFEGITCCLNKTKNVWDVGDGHREEILKLASLFLRKKDNKEDMFPYKPFSFR